MIDPETDRDAGGRREQIVLIGGMHRSGTSLVAGLLHSAGVDVGSRLLGPHPGNPDGHFEDLDFVELHQSCLTDGLRAGLVDGDLPVAWTAATERRARELLREKSGPRTWGWKDPRSSLFLDRWSQLVPGLSTVAVVRHPFDVVLSLLRRGTETEVLVDPRLALDTWRIYNSAILRHLRKSPERAVLFDVYEVLAAPREFLATVDERLGLGLDLVGGVDKLPKEHLLRASVASPVVDGLLGVLDERSLHLWRQLCKAAQPLVTATGRRDRHPIELERDLDALGDLLREILRGRPPAVAPALDLVLAMLDPELDAERRVRARGALDDLRAHAGNLEERVAGLIAHATNLEARRDELEKHTANLEWRVGELTTHAHNLEQLVDRRRGGGEPAGPAAAKSGGKAAANGGSRAT